MRADVVVIGAGAAGSATAYWLARDGLDVVLVEQFERGHDRGSSHGGSRIFRYGYANPLYVGMVTSALPLWREIEEASGTTLVELTGVVDHGEADQIESVVDALAAVGVEHERLRPAEAEARWPGMRFDTAVVFQPGGGRCRADDSVRVLQDLAEGHGATLHFGTGPASLRITTGSGGAAVEVVAGASAWRAPVAVVAAGGWVGSVLTGSEVPLPPVKVTQEQVQHFAARPGAGPDVWPSFIHRHRALHYGLETPDEGIKVGVHQAGVEVDPDDRPKWNDEFERGIVQYVETWLPALDPAPVTRSLCLYTNTADDDFVIDRRGPIVVGSPCSGHGFKFTPLVGRLLADLAQGRALPPEMEKRFSASRVAAPHAHRRPAS